MLSIDVTILTFKYYYQRFLYKDSAIVGIIKQVRSNYYYFTR
ncbi:hypothetical protein VCR12J2_1360046 [Vibrio coralliirubri]|nr:hypothetical protein VCR26J2_150150 [Vibrio coralliirubri]CDT73428.1 hypothetical protein VCR29J2_450058 [Vibrio coralliirubri]CDT85085.1 hypothetical protein VCR12J2_1360046 [Vibrio coralliirubri]